MDQLVLDNVFYSYEDGYSVFNGLSLSVKKGEYLSIVGKNGGGKSTLAKLFNGLLLPKAGKVKVDGLDTSDKKNTFEIRKRVGMVFQNPDNQLVASIVEDDVAFGPENLGLPREEIKERIRFALKAVGMEDFLRVSPERLSGGQKQRIAIAGILALKPEILVLDESTSMLDPVGRKEVLKVIEKLNKENQTTVITVTHYMDEVVKADRVIVLDNGKIALEGTPKQIFEQKAKLDSLDLELPMPTYIACKLKENGVKISDGILLDEELSKALCEL